MSLAEDCICCEYDGRGRSCCGFECPIHPLNGKCPCPGHSETFIGRKDNKLHVVGHERACSQKTHNNVLCINCTFAKDFDK